MGGETQGLAGWRAMASSPGCTARVVQGANPERDPRHTRLHDGAQDVLTESH